ncbi:hypothetical protein HGM15179_013416 [Zosterops borbonicus]|uniref:Uncharacterized protein n=1 Tax=Zosterops borbonicus TaxID=364589 RepID=A0A8K1G822_9PASS|nr:hypothetical protein HGM15179_013416 [Zosterops borbonicus]
MKEKRASGITSFLTRHRLQTDSSDLGWPNWRSEIAPFLGYSEGSFLLLQSLAAVGEIRLSCRHCQEKKRYEDNCIMDQISPIHWPGGIESNIKDKAGPTGKFVPVCEWLLLLLKGRVVVLRQDPQWDEETLKWRNVFLTGHPHLDSALTLSRYNLTRVLGQFITSLAEKHKEFRSSNPTLCLPRASSHQGYLTEQTIRKANLAEIQTAKS